MIIGITGTLGAGKGTVVEYLVSKGFVHVAVSDTFLVGEAHKRGLEPTRKVRHDIANEFRAKGPTRLMEAVYELAVPAVTAGENTVLEPQHTVDEVRFIQSKGGIVIGVDADIKTRYERIQKRGSAKDNVSFEEFRDFEQLEMKPGETSSNNLSGAVAAADVRIQNNGTLEELHAQIEEALKKLVTK